VSDARGASSTAAVFDFRIRPDTMTELDALEEGLVTGWDPRSLP